MAVNWIGRAISIMVSTEELNKIGEVIHHFIIGGYYGYWMENSMTNSG